MCYSLCKELKIDRFLLSVPMDKFSMKSNSLIWHSWPGFNSLSAKKGDRDSEKKEKDKHTMSGSETEKGSRRREDTGSGWFVPVPFHSLWSATSTDPDNRCRETWGFPRWIVSFNSVRVPGIPLLMTPLFLCFYDSFFFFLIASLSSLPLLPALPWPALAWSPFPYSIDPASTSRSHVRCPRRPLRSQLWFQS